jgi:VIT1/CCC1 family predicted Fe2+/Mn2+ transporter
VNSTSNTERPLTAILSSIFGNVQEIVRSEVKFAKTEVREEIAQLSQGATWLAAGMLSAFFAICFLLGAAFFALSYLMPQWMAALIIAGLLLIVSGVSFAVRGSISKAYTNDHTQLADSQTQESIA